MKYLIDSNVLLDVLTEDPVWFEWSAPRLVKCAEDGIMVINAIIHGEVSNGFDRIEDLETALPLSVLNQATDTDHRHKLKDQGIMRTSLTIWTFGSRL